MLGMRAVGLRRGLATAAICLLVSGAGSQPPGGENESLGDPAATSDPDERSKRISVTLASLLLPGGWHYHWKSPARITFARRSGLPVRSLAGLLVLSKLGPVESLDHFLEEVSKQRASGPRDPRYENLVHDESVADEAGVWVVRWHIKYKDFGAPNLPADASYLVVEDFGAAFRHPQQTDVAVSVSVSQRSLARDLLPDFGSFAGGVIDTIQFESPADP